MFTRLTEEQRQRRHEERRARARIRKAQQDKPMFRDPEEVMREVNEKVKRLLGYEV